MFMRTLTRRTRSGPVVTSEIELVTPAAAHEWVTNNNGNNRPISERHVKRLQTAMERGEFLLSNDAITFDASGNLLNGQHRLIAIVRSGVACWFVVMRGADADTFKVMDSGRARSASDILAIARVENPAYVGAAARVVLNFLNGKALRYSPSRFELTEYASTDADADYLAEVVGRTKSAKKTVTVSVLAAVIFLATKDGSNREHIDSFVEGIATGINLNAGDPRLTLREWVNAQRNKRSYRMIDPEGLFAATVYAWNAYVEGRGLKRIPTHDGQVDRIDLRIAGLLT